tara:strand:- start:25144 stop:25341 length:198 start_codon:yes stop_codon:yes gene_type:complete
MKIERIGEYAKFNLRMINSEGSQAKQTERVVKKMEEVQRESAKKLVEPSPHMQKFNNSIKKLDVI